MLSYFEWSSCQTGFRLQLSVAAADCFARDVYTCTVLILHGTAHTIQSHYDACSELSTVLELQLMSYTHSCDRLLGELTYCMSPGEQILGGGLEPLGPHEVGAYVDTSF